MKNKESLFKETRAVSGLMEFIFTSGIAIALFTIMLLYSQGLFIEDPGETVALERFSDIGNDVSTKIVDIYIIAPENGKIVTDLTMPTSVGGHDYQVNTQAQADQMVTVSSLTSSDLEVTVSINGITHTVGVTGTTSSRSTQHQLSYDSSL
ncbi:MAG: hypothetical protein SVM80_03765 [Halobacteriota archaeon]|nr:hypothetical protein [Halobacteriota archaeon]